MKFYNLLVVIILISIKAVQSQHCFIYPDSRHCYKMEKFTPIATRIEKKLELSNQVIDGSIQLLVDIDGDCKSELITISRRGDSIFIIDLI